MNKHVKKQDQETKSHYEICLSDRKNGQRKRLGPSYILFVASRASFSEFRLKRKDKGI